MLEAIDSRVDELLNVATKNQLFQFNGNLYEQVDGVAMGSKAQSWVFRKVITSLPQVKQPQKLGAVILQMAQYL